MKIKHVGSIAVTVAALLSTGLAHAQPVPPPPEKVDVTPPTIKITYPQGGFEGWYSDTQSIQVDVSDQGTNGGGSSRVEEVSYVTTGATTGSGTLGNKGGDVTIRNQGSTLVQVEAYDFNRNHATSAFYVGIDRAKPTIGFNLAPGAEIPRGAQVVAGYWCNDDHSGVRSCAADVAPTDLLDTSTPGVFSLTVDAVDNVGNSHHETLSYRVVPSGMTVVSPPRVTGTPRLGERLTVEPARFAPEPSDITHQWYRDGKAIDGADQAWYEVVKADIGHRLHYSASAELAGHTGTIATASPVEVRGQLQAVGATSITGRPRIGATLSVRLPDIVTVGDTASALLPTDQVDLQWLRDGTAAPGATGEHYRPRAADLGKRIGVRVTIARAHHDTLELTAPATPKVAKATARLTAKAKRTRGKVELTVRATATGVEVTGGKVEVRAGKRRIAKAPLRRGRAILAFRARPGQKLVVLHRGTSLVQASKTRIKAPR